MEESRLNSRQEAFVRAFVSAGCTNAKAAAVKAGYAESCAEVTGSKLLSLAKVQAAIAALRRPAQEAAIVDAAYVFTKLRTIVEYGTDTRVDGETGETVLVNPKEANAALRTLASALGLGREKVDKDQTIQALAESLTEALSRA